MEFEQLLANRRSIRKYKIGKEVDKDAIYKILDAARLCQSARNRQPWLFKILDKQSKDNIAKMMLTYHRNNIGQENSCRSTAEYIADAPVMILVFKEINTDWDTADTLSIGAAINNICLEATNLGYGSLWINDTAYIKDEIVQLYGKPNIELISSILIGYADENPELRPRKSINDIILK
jgi:nitroreductase